jgi:hypothetical protein
VFRKLSAEYEGNKYLGGSMRPLIEYSILSDITEKRIVDVKKMITNAESM